MTYIVSSGALNSTPTNLVPAHFYPCSLVVLAMLAGRYSASQNRGPVHVQLSREALLLLPPLLLKHQCHEQHSQARH